MSKILVFGHKSPDTDSIASSIAMSVLETKLGNETEAVRLGDVNKETKFVFDFLNMEEPRFISEVENGAEVILVDHNECGQSADNIENAQVLKVIDHHQICFKTGYPLTYRAEPVGCTATIIYKMYKENFVEIDKNIATLMLSAIISDTLLFKSPTSTPIDRQVAEELLKITDIDDMQNYGMQMLKSRNKP